MKVIDPERGVFTIYDPHTGVILASGYGIITDEMLDGGYKHLRAASDNTMQYVDVLAKEVRVKRGFNAPKHLAGVSDGVTETVIEVPVGTTAGDVTCDDGSLELTFDTPGDHTIILQHPHYLDTPVLIPVKEPPE